MTETYGPLLILPLDMAERMMIAPMPGAERPRCTYRRCGRCGLYLLRWRHMHRGKVKTATRIRCEKHREKRGAVVERRHPETADEVTAEPVGS